MNPAVEELVAASEAILGNRTSKTVERTPEYRRLRDAVTLVKYDGAQEGVRRPFLSRLFRRDDG